MVTSGLQRIRSISKVAQVRATLMIFLMLSATHYPVYARPFEINDYLMLERITRVEVSAHSELAAVAVSRPKLVGDNYTQRGHAHALDPSRENLLVVSARDGAVVYEDNGEKSGASAFSAKWSPDGRRLAYLRSSRDGSTSLVVWDRVSGVKRTLVAGGVTTAAPLFRSPNPNDEAHPFAWVGSSEIVFGRTGGSFAADDLAPDRAIARAAVGRFSGRVWRTIETPLCRPDDILAVVRVNDGVITDIARGAILSASVSPGEDALAVVTATAHLKPPSDRPIRYPPRYLTGDFAPFVKWSASTIVRRLGKWTTLPGATEGQGPILGNTMPRWHADGNRWAALLVDDPFAESPSSQLVNVDLADGERKVASYTSRLQAIAALSEWAGEKPRRAIESSELLASMPSNIKLIEPDAIVNIDDTASGRHLVTTNKGGVSSLWSVHRDKATRLIEINSHLSDIEQPKPKLVQYSINGEKRTGWLFIPIGASGKVPAVAIGYPNSDPWTARLVRLDGQPTPNFLLANGIAVFIVDFRISEPGDRSEEPVDRILSEIGTGVDALEGQSQIDAQRISFFGHSFGGYSAITLLANTSYFRSIVVAAPLGDLTSYAFKGEDAFFDQKCGAAQVLVKQMSHEDPGSAESRGYHKNMIMRMGGPPYDNIEKYIRNSPIYHLSKAVTPTLIIQGQQDGFNDGERLYNTLYRRGVDAKLLYYWGEGHGVESPENIIHMNEQILEWVIGHSK